MTDVRQIAARDLPPGAAWGFVAQLRAFYHWRRMDAALDGDPVAMTERLGYYGA